MNEKLLDQNVEETTTEEVVLDASDSSIEEQQPTEEQKDISSKTIKDYLSKDLFKDIKVISNGDNIEDSEKSSSSLDSEYANTFKDISENTFKRQFDNTSFHAMQFCFLLKAILSILSGGQMPRLCFTYVNSL